MNKRQTQAFWILAGLTLLAFLVVLHSQFETVDTASGQSYPSPSQSHGTSLQYETPRLIPVTDAPPITGILEGQGQEIRPSEATINNRWAGFVRDTYVVVFAGALADDPAQGIIYVVTVSSDKKGTIWNHYLTPTKTGSVRIVSVEGTRLVLASESGTTLSFDVSTLQFVPLSGER